MLWQDIPQWRRLGRLVALPGVCWLANKVYDHLLAPALYHWHLSRQRRLSARDAAQDRS